MFKEGDEPTVLRRSNSLLQWQFSWLFAFKANAKDLLPSFKAKDLVKCSTFFI